MYLLAQFRERQACPVIVELFTRHSHAFMDWCADFVTEDLPRVLAAVSGGATSGDS